MKKIVLKREVWLEPGDFISSHLCFICTRKNSSDLAQVFFLLEHHSHCW